MPMRSSLGSLLVSCLVLAGCAVLPAGPERPAGGPSGKADGEGDLVPAVLGDADDGAIVTVAVGQTVTVRLSENRSTGFTWYVTATDRSFGYPTDDTFEAPDDGLVGSGGTRVLTWRTDGAFPLSGLHHVTLGYVRPGAFCGGIAAIGCPAGEACALDGSYPDAGGRCIGDPVRRFSFGVNVVVPGEAPVVLREENDGALVHVQAGQPVTVRLPENPSTGFTWHVTATDRSFGYPAEDAFLPPDDGLVGSGGTRVLTWRTDGAFPLEGMHHVKLGYARMGAFCGGIAAIGCPEGEACVLDGTYPDAGGHCVGEPVRTFSFGVDIAAAATPGGPAAPLSLTSTDADLDLLAAELESDHGTFEDGNAAVAFLYDYDASGEAGLEDALAGVANTLAADGTFEGELESKGDIVARTFQRALTRYGFGSGFFADVREAWEIDGEEPVLYGKLAGTGTTTLASGLPDPADAVVYVAHFPASRHVLAVLDYQLTE